jgi:hypothetical protein
VIEVGPLSRHFSCGSCNVAGRFHQDIKSHQRWNDCDDDDARLVLQNGFCSEEIRGFTGPDGVVVLMEPWLVSGDDYRGVRDRCDVSPQLVKR